MTTKQTIGYEEIIAYAQRILDGGEITPKVRLLTHVPANALKTVNSAPNRLITKQALPYIRL